jgi:hypothetical protein
MARSGDDEQIEILVGLDERVDDLHRGGWVHVLVEFADDKHQIAGELRGVRHVGIIRVLGADRPAHPLLMRSARLLRTAG